MNSFNLFSLVFICLPFPVMMVTCSYFLYSDGLFSYAGFVALEVIAISTLMSCLMLVDSVSALSCAKTKAKIGAAPAPAKVQSAVVDLDYESEDEDAGKRMLKKKRGNKEVEEFGEDDSVVNDGSMSRINPYTTNNSITLDENDKKQL